MKTPRYCLHKGTGQAVVYIDRKPVYLGLYDSPKSRAKYDVEIVAWLNENSSQANSFTINELCLMFVSFAESYYQKNGEPTSEVYNIRLALRPLVRLFGKSRATDFGPKKLKDVRQAMIDAGCVRTSINRQVDRIRRMFRWAVENEHVPTTVCDALSKVAGLKRDRSTAKESDPVTPVSMAMVDAVRPFVSRQIWAMIQLQLLTGGRPGEIRIMRGCDLNMAGRIWEYRPASHKTEHHGKSRTIFIGPKAQVIVTEFLKPDTTSFLFSPADAKAEFHAARKAKRTTPTTPSQRRRRAKKNPKKTPGSKYTVHSYRQAIVKACDKAEIPHWHPNQLRHNAGTVMRREFGIEATRTVLGHSQTATTEIYAEKDFDTARDVIAKIG